MIDLFQMWSIDYVAETIEEESIDTGSVDIPTSASIDKDTNQSGDVKLLKQDSTKSEGEVATETKTEDEPDKRQAAIKRVEELVKQMSLSQETENEGKLNLLYVKNVLSLFMIIVFLFETVCTIVTDNVRSEYSNGKV